MFITDETTPNGTHPTPPKPIQLSVTLPNTRVNLHLTFHSTNTLLLFLTTSNPETGPISPATLGSLVFAMPDRYTSQPLSTALYSSATSVDFATRMARALARKTGQGCYVGGSVNLASSAVGGGGGSVEEEMEVFRALVDVVVGQAGRSEESGS